MDYSKERQIEPEEIKNTSMKMGIQETYKILNEMDEALSEFEVYVSGKHRNEEKRQDASCLCEEVRMVTALAYECLQKVLRIKNCVV